MNNVQSFITRRALEITKVERLLSQQLASYTLGATKTILTGDDTLLRKGNAGM